MLSTDRLDLLRLFVQVAESGTISDAAEVVGISQPSASRLLRKLEMHLETQLVQRTGSGITLTPSGHDMLGAARTLLRQWEGVLDVTGAHRSRLSGHVRIAVSVPIGEALLGSLVARFVKKHPGVTVECDLRDDQIDLNAIGYDLWVRVGPIKSDRLVVRTISGTPRAIFCSPSIKTCPHPQDLKDLRAVRVKPYVQEVVTLTNENDESYSLHQHCALTTNSLFAGHAAILEGIGYAVLPFWLVELDLHAGRLVRTCPSWKAARIILSIAYLPGAGRPARTTALVNFLRQELSDAANVHEALLHRQRTLSTSRESSGSAGKST